MGQIYAVLAIIVFVVAVSAYRTRQRKASALSRPFPREWRDILRRNVGIYERLPEALQRTLEDRIKVFLVEKKFFGCDGLEITDEIRVTIAGHACLLILNRVSDFYPQQQSIFVYPSPYFGEKQSRDGFIEHSERHVRHGEAWHRGPVVLAWDSVVSGAYDLEDGDNVVVHEFAHQLDFEDGLSDGTPQLGARRKYSNWARTMGEEFEKLNKEYELGNDTFLNPYGATNPAEFFAVITESFFERPVELREKHPEVYAQLQEFFGLDPASWTGEPNVRDS